MELKGRHILIVDDNTQNLKVSGKLLKDEGYLISMAINGTSALELLEREIPDIILLDVMMPDINGLEVCRKIKLKEHLKDIPILFLTAKVQPEDLEEGFNAGAVDYITKPFNRNELLLRIKTHLELALSKKELVESNLARDKLYSIIAHDIRSPLAGIKTTLSALNEGLLDPCSDIFSELATELESTTTATLDLLKNLLEWTRFKSKYFELTCEEQDLYPVVFECVKILQNSAQNKDIIINNNLEINTLAVFDRKTISTVIRNIISNAIKFTHKRGTIDILPEANNSHLRLCIKDNGVGMEEKLLQKVLDRNKYESKKGTSNEQGSGLGLVLVSDFVEKNNGKFSIQSVPGKGTSVIIDLPRNI